MVPSRLDPEGHSLFRLLGQNEAELARPAVLSFWRPWLDSGAPILDRFWYFSINSLKCLGAVGFLSIKDNLINAF